MDDIDKKIEELQMKKKLMEKEKELETLRKQMAPQEEQNPVAKVLAPCFEQNEEQEPTITNIVRRFQKKEAPVTEPAEDIESLKKKLEKLVYEQEIAKIQTSQKGERDNSQPSPAQQPPVDPVQQFLNKNKGPSINVQNMQQEDAQFMPRRVAATEVSKWLNVIVMLGTLNIIFGFMLFTFNLFGLSVISTVMVVVIIAVDGYYMIKAARQKNYLAMKYQIAVPRSLFSRKKQQQYPPQQQPPQQYPPQQPNQGF